MCATVGTGGLFSGGGYGFLMRKYGLASDNIIDAKIIDVNGNILEKKDMGEDLFWAIRGGGGASFGVIVAWKIKLVPIPSTVTVFNVTRTLAENETDIIQKWQLVANKLDDRIYLRMDLARANPSEHGKLTIQANFVSIFLGGAKEFIHLIQTSFPELGLDRKDCTGLVGLVQLYSRMLC